MTRTWSLYDSGTGLFVGKTIMCPEDHLSANILDGHAATEGRHDHLSSKVDISTGAVIDHQPPRPSQDHEWNANAKRWCLTATAQAREAAIAISRARRAVLIELQHDDVRRVALNPQDTQARKALQAIEDEMSAINAELAGEGSHPRAD